MNCPVCFNIPAGPVYQCHTGHHICDICYETLNRTQCPLCQSKYYGTRNFLAEEMAQKLPVLCVRDTVNQADLSSNTDEQNLVKKKAPSYCRGVFPCHLKSCLKKFPAGRMLSHIRYHHPGLLTEVRLII